jgi:hypothetical protein
MLKVLPLALVVIAVTAVVAFVARADDESHGISPPLIYPNFSPPGGFAGTVKVTFVPNSPNSDLYYYVLGPNTDERPATKSNKETGSLTGADAAAIPLPFKAPSDSELKGAAFHLWRGAPVLLSLPGWYVVYARSIPQNPSSQRNASDIEFQLLRIQPSKLSPPTVRPPASRHYTGSVEVTLTRAAGTGSGSDEGCDVKYSIDDPGLHDDHQTTWVSLHEGGTVELDSIGQHIIYAKCVTKDGTESPIAQFMYYIDPEPMYDVGAECAKCDYKPTLGRPFTLVLQGVKAGDMFFVTDSAAGCSVGAGGDAAAISQACGALTSPQGIGGAQRTWKCHGIEQKKLWVCLQSKGDKDFQVLPRRGTAHAYFEIAAAVDANPNLKPEFELTAPPETAAPTVEHKQPSVMSAGVGFTWITLIIALVLLVALVWLIKIVRHMLEHRRPGPRRTGGALPSTDE